MDSDENYVWLENNQHEFDKLTFVACLRTADDKYFSNDSASNIWNIALQNPQ